MIPLSAPDPGQSYEFWKHRIFCKGTHAVVIERFNGNAAAPSSSSAASDASQKNFTAAVACIKAYQTTRDTPVVYIKTFVSNQLIDKDEHEAKLKVNRQLKNNSNKRRKGNTGVVAPPQPVGLEGYEPQLREALKPIGGELLWQVCSAAAAGGYGGSNGGGNGNGSESGYVFAQCVTGGNGGEFWKGTPLTRRRAADYLMAQIATHGIAMLQTVEEHPALLQPGGEYYLLDDEYVPGPVSRSGRRGEVQEIPGIDQGCKAVCATLDEVLTLTLVRPEDKKSNPRCRTKVDEEDPLENSDAEDGVPGGASGRAGPASDRGRAAVRGRAGRGRGGASKRR